MAFSHNQTITMLSAWLLASCFFTSAFCLQPNVLQPFDLLYESGISAYYSNEYSKVVNHIEGALDSYATLKSIKVSCWLKCRHENGFETLLSSSASLFDIAFFNVLLHRAYCIKECQTQQLGVPSMHQANIEIVNDFYRRTPYNYLQHAYFKLKQFDKAAAAAHTFFMANPEHVEMQQNLEHYKLMAGADESNLIDREAKPHMEAFSAGVIYYDKQMYTLAIKSFEEALEKYYKADLECRALCDQPLKFTEYEYLDYKLPLYEAFADHYTQILSCEHDCVRDLATRSGRISPLENYLPSHYEYLQFSYYKAGEYEKALQCAKAYLLFHPEDEDIMGDIEHYVSLLPDMINPKDIEPRKDAVEFMHRYLLERELLKQVSDAAGVRYYEPKYWVVLKSNEVINRMPADAVMQTEVDSTESGSNTTEQALREEIHEGGPVLYDNIKLVYQSEQLNGSHRVMMDEVITPQECKDLHQVAQVITFAGDGYKGRMSPHTPNERFEGATVLKALLSGYNGQISLKSAQLFYEVSEKARKIVESYFRLNSTLYFSYTHLVCRTAITGHQDYRNDLSHPIHADNCLLDPEISICWKEPPAFTYRDYSAILYLNGDFDGGEFIFTTMDTKTVTASVKPRCGRMVSFSSGGENPHGVRAVTKGQRCALAMWFTLDPVFREEERLQADEVMATIQEEQQMRNELDLNPKDEL